MPSYDTAYKKGEDVQPLIKKYVEYWEQGQKPLDELQLKFILLTNRDLSVAEPPKGGVPKVFQSGIGGIVWREDAALLAVEPSITVNAPADDRELLDIANEKLEPWITGALKRSQKIERVFTRKAGGLRAIGRDWSTVYPVPGKWVTPELKGLIAKLQKSDSEDDIKRIKRQIEGIRRDNWPIRWRKEDPRTVWPAPFGGDERLPIVAQHRKMSGLEICTEYGDEYLPGDYKDKDKDTSATIDVYPFANHFCSGVLIGSGEDPKIAGYFEHGLEMSPYVLMEADLLPENDKNWRWGGALFHCTDLIETFDELLSDYRTYTHNYTLSPLGMFFDPAEYEEDAKVAGRPKDMKLEPGQTYPFWTTEDVKPIYNAQMNTQQVVLLQEVKELIYSNMIRPAERGEAKAGTSNNAYSSQVQVAEREFQPSVQASQDAYENVAVLHLRAVRALNADTENPDPVYVLGAVGGKKSYIGLLPDETLGWEHAIQARMARAIPIDRNTQLLVAKGLTDMGVAPEQALEEELGYANPDRVIERGWQSKIDQALFDQDLQAILALSGQMFAQPTPEQEAKLQEKLAGAEPEVQQVVGQLFGGTSGPERQGNSNTMRAGTVQQPQQTEQAVMPQ